MSSTLPCDLNDDVATLNVYDKTKTSIFGHVKQSTINSNLVLGPPLIPDLDITTDSLGTIVPGNGIHYTTNGRVFVIGAVSAGSAQIGCYSLNSVTGVAAWIGRITVSFPNTAATTHTVRSFKVYDAGTTGWKIFTCTTGSVAVNGGTFLVNKVDLADFGISGGTSFPFAAAGDNDAKRTYFLQDSGAFGVAHVQTANTGTMLDYSGQFIYSHNGTAATHQIYKYNIATAPTVTAQSTVTITIASPGVVSYTSHPFANNDQVVLSTTGALPTGLTAGTVYFVRNSAANTFELSATSGGASINTTGSQSGTHTIVRAFGQTGALFTLKTGNLPALSGTTLQTNSETYRTPSVVPANTGLNGQNVLFFATTTNLYMGLASEITSLTTTWPSLTGVNLLGAANEIVTPTATIATYSQTLDRAVYVTNTSVFVMKQFISNQITAVFGSVDTQYLEGAPSVMPNFGFAAVSGMDIRQGWIVACGSTVGQRTILAIDMFSDSNFGNSYIISKVLDSNGATLRGLCTAEELFEITSTMDFYYRTAPNGDSVFNSASGGWIQINTSADLNIILDDQVQFKIDGWNLASKLSSNPAQVHDITAIVTQQYEMSSKWVGDEKHTSLSGASPFYIAFRQQYAYGTPIPRHRVDIIDDNETIIQSLDSVTDIALFSYSSNDGGSWVSYGTPPDSALTTVVRVLVSSPAPGKLRARIIEV